MKKILVILLLSLTSLYSQEIKILEEKPKIGLVLAGGGAWGFAHVGVLRILEEAEIPISYITGTSIGSIIGSLYAMGYSVNELETLIRSTNWFEVLNDSIQRSELSAYNKNSFQDYLFGFSIHDKQINLPGGIIDGQKVDYLLTKLHWNAKDIKDFSQFPIPFSCLATDIKTGDAVILKEGDITDSVRASMSIPGVFTPVEIDNRILVDGMFAMNLPVTNVKDMGADIVIAVNFNIPETGLADYSSVTGALFQSFLMNMNRSIREQLPYADIVISPDISKYSTFDYDKVDDIYKQGIKAAKLKFNELKKLSDPELYKKISNKKLSPKGKVKINSIEITGVNPDMETNIKRVMGLHNKKNLFLSNSEIEKKIRDVYSLGFYDLITYKIREEKLIINIKKKKTNVFNVATEFDYIDNASLLLNLKSHGFNKINYLSDLSIKLGEKRELRERISLNLGFINLIGIFSETNFTKDYYPVSEQNYLEDSYEIRTSLGIGISLSRYLLGTLAVSYDHFNLSHGYNTFIIQSKLNIDTLDKTIYPEKGILLDLAYDWAIPTEIGTDYNKVLFKSLFVIPVIKKHLSFIIGLDEGFITTDKFFRDILGIDSLYDIPENQQIYVGGNKAENNTISLIGYKKKELSYTYSFVMHTGIQIQPYNDIFLQIKLDGALLSNDQDNLSENVHWGYGLAAGISTLLGPLEVSISGNQYYEFSFNISIGYNI